jgi:hypothetical protein
MRVIMLNVMRIHSTSACWCTPLIQTPFTISLSSARCSIIIVSLYICARRVTRHKNYIVEKLQLFFTSNTCSQFKSKNFFPLSLTLVNIILPYILYNQHYGSDLRCACIKFVKNSRHHYNFFIWLIVTT